MFLKDYKFGCADATRELLLEPDIFKCAFYDPNNILDKLLTTWRYMLIGRKGVGKSAFSSKIRYMSEKQEEYYTCFLNLEELEYGTLKKASIDGDTVGTKKYMSTWKLLILLEIFKYVRQNLKVIEAEEFNNTVKILEKLGIDINKNFNDKVTNISKIKLGVNIGVFDANFEQEFGVKAKSFSDKIHPIIEMMLDSLFKVYLDKRIFILIDGVDDILRIKKNQIDLLASMVRAINSLNSFMYEKNINIKILLFIREDIFNKINDPDFNKIKRDGAIFLSWTNNTDDLRKMADMRFNLSGNIGWDEIFPPKLRNKDSWSTLLEHTLYRPRDILQFLCICQETYPNKEKLLQSDMRNVLKLYSREYFIDEMKNELSGFIDDDLINIIPSIIQKIGSDAFNIEELTRIMNKELSNEGYNKEIIKNLAFILFEAGYIGQIVEGFKGKNRSVIFKYRNPHAIIDYSKRMIIHRGLQRGIGIIM